ncbi:hypothetical protein [uncultured Methanobrevibacter sp.]|uniref:hypothetical protein n=1 Tax=uncultured Methanobrevibacter sp. TaxID=253161 RepID=UPI0025E1DB85|nr:hypothetical protein [uncultured Methanobrevibacter sp.]
MMFTNAKKVMIGNKEVQSIVTSNGGVLYERPIPDNYAIDLVSDVNSLSSANNESATLTATLTNNNNPVSGKTVILSDPYNQSSVSKTLTADTWTPVGAKYEITISKTLLFTVYLSSGMTIKWDNVDDRYEFEVGGFYDAGDLHDFYVENGIVHYIKGSTAKTYDASHLDLTRIKCRVSGCVINDYGGFYSKKTTNSSGIATSTYYARDTGNKTITASSMGVSDTVQINVT